MNTKILCFPLVFIVALIIFLPSAKYSFVFDDDFNIRGNTLVTEKLDVAKIFITPSYPGDLYRPVTTLSYAIQYSISKASPIPFHQFNILLHAAVCLLIFYLLLMCKFNNFLAFASAIIFASHPIHTEAVANIIGRAELLACCFVLSSIILALKFPYSKIASFFAGLLFLAGCASKESAISGVILFIIFNSHLGIDLNKSIKKSIYIFVPALICYFALRYNALDGVIGERMISAMDNPLLEESFFSRAFYGLLILGKYIVHIILPFPLSAEYGFARLDIPLNLWSLETLGYGLSIICLIVAAFSKNPNFNIGPRIFFGSFIITSNILTPIGTIFAERLTYLPSLGICISLSFLLQKLIGIWRVISLAVIVLIYGIYIIKVIPMWETNDSLFTREIKISHQSARTQVNYGIVLRNKGSYDEAMIHFREALEISPGYAHAAYGIASVYALMRVSSGAEHWARKALEFDPKHSPSADLLGRVLLSQGRIPLAHKIFEHWLEKFPDRVEFKIGLIAVLIAEGDKLRAAKLLQEIKGDMKEDSDVKYLDSQLNAPYGEGLL